MSHRGKVLGGSALAAFAISGGLALAACSSGQTGSAACAPPQACECALLGGKHLAMVTVLELEPNATSFRIEEVLSPDEALEQSEAPTTLSASIAALTSWPCVRTDSTLRAGDSALAVLGFHSASGDSGRTERTLSSITLLPWTDALQLGGAEPTPLSELVKLTEKEVCDARFPPPPTTSCDDVSEGEGCSMRSAPGSAGARGAWAVLGSLLLVAARRAREARRS